MYRIDNRIFSIGDSITPQRLYQSQLRDGKIEVEQILEANRLQMKPKRTDILMLFEDFESAKSHWIKQKDGIFYEVSINDQDIIHIGDYSKVEELYDAISKGKDYTHIAMEYWNGMFSKKPVKEFFVMSACVKNVISNSEEERKNEFKAKYLNILNPKIRRIINPLN